MSEALIERSLLHELGTAEDTEGIVHRITLPRAPPAHISDDHRDVVENTIRDFFMPHLKPATVYVEDPEPEDDVFTARVRFTDPIKGFAVFEKIRNEDKGLCIDEQPVEMKPLARANITVQMQIWELSHAGVQEAIALLNDLNVTIHINDEEERRRQLTIEASSIEDIVCARTLIEDVMRGQTIDCTAAGMLSTADGAAVLRQLEQETGAKVKMDRRGHRLTVYGTQQASFQVMCHRSFSKRFCVALKDKLCTCNIMFLSCNKYGYHLIECLKWCVLLRVWYKYELIVCHICAWVSLQNKQLFWLLDIRFIMADLGKGRSPSQFTTRTILETKGSVVKSKLNEQWVTDRVTPPSKKKKTTTKNP